MKYLRYAAAAALCLVLQTSAIPFISFRGVEPDLILCLLVFFSLREGALAGALGGFLLGLSQDVYSPQALGAGAFAACATGFLTGQLDERRIRIDDRYKILLLFLAALFHQGIRISLAFGLRAALGGPLVVQIASSAVYTALLGGALLLFPGRRG